MVAASLFYGAMNISIKLGGVHLTVWQTAMGRFLLGLVFMPILIRVLRLEWSGQERRLLIARGLSGTVAFLLMIQAVKLIPLSMAMVLFYLWPVFTCLLSPIIAGEPTTRREWPLVITALLGTAVILWPERGGSGLSLGHFLSLASSFFAGLAVILIRRLRRRNNPFTIYFYFCVSGGAATAGPLLAQREPLLPVSVEGWVLLSAVAVFAMVGQVLMNQGIKYLDASRIGALMMTEVLVATAFGALALGETLHFRFFTGAILILGSGAALMIFPPKPAVPDPPENG
jgi:drug/metabolite transporter (DMT)-like permease